MVNVCIINDGIMRVKLVYGREILNVVGAYVLQVEVKESLKKKFWLEPWSHVSREDMSHCICSS